MAPWQTHPTLRYFTSAGRDLEIWIMNLPPVNTRGDKKKRRFQREMYMLHFFSTIPLPQNTNIGVVITEAGRVLGAARGE